MLEKAANVIVNQCLSIKNYEKVLIITDKNKLKIANSILNEAKKITKHADLIEMPVAKFHGEEPPENISNKMQYYNVIIAPTTYSITHTRAVQQATKRDARVATMPGITEEIMYESLMADYHKIKHLTEHVNRLIRNTKFIHVTSKNGTDLKFLIKRERNRLDTGLIYNNGQCGNLPAGEFFTAPLEGTANGTLVIDLMQDGKEIYAKKGTKIIIKNSLAEKISDKNCLLASYFSKIKNSKVVAEFGIGTNEKARLIGQILQDEKVLGTCHIAFGNNTSMGGVNYSKVHMDAIVDKPTIHADNEVIMKEGKLKV